MDYRLIVSGVDDANRRDKYLHAVGALAKSMRVPYTLREPRSHGQGKQEEFPFLAYRDLVEEWNDWYEKILEQVYKTTCTAFDIPEVGRLQKARKNLSSETRSPRPEHAGQEFMAWKGRVLYSPETGKPISRFQWDAFVTALEQFLNRNLKEAEKRLVLSAAALGKILDRMLKFNTWEAVKRLRLDEARSQAGEKVFSDEGSFRRHFKVPVSEADRIKVAETSAGIYIQGIAEKTRDTVRTILVEGIKERSTKGEVGQVLFDKLGGLNRDWQRIVETETNESMNRAFLASQAAQAPAGEKIYFQRYEAADEAVCKHCNAIKGRVVLWVNEPRESEKIEDPYASVAIWDGKSRFRRKAKDPWIAAGTQHPWCRGVWSRWYPPSATKTASFDAMQAKLRARSEAWGTAVEKARVEFRAKGIMNPTDETPGYLDRINVLFKEAL